MAEQGYTACFLDDNVLIARKEFALARYSVSDPRAPKEMGRVGPSGYSAVALHRPGQLLALAAQTNPAPPYHLQIYTLAGGTQTLRREIALEFRVARLDFDPAGERILAVGLNNSGTFVFDVKTGERRLKLPKTERAVFNATGDRIIALVPTKRTANDVDDDVNDLRRRERCRAPARAARPAPQRTRRLAGSPAHRHRRQSCAHPSG